jgi:hypothetical protein
MMRNVTASGLFLEFSKARRFHGTSLISAPEAPIVVALKKGRPPPDLRYFDQAKKTGSLEK